MRKALSEAPRRLFLSPFIFPVFIANPLDLPITVTGLTVTSASPTHFGVFDVTLMAGLSAPMYTPTPGKNFRTMHYHLHVLENVIGNVQVSAGDGTIIGLFVPAVDALGAGIIEVDISFKGDGYTQLNSNSIMVTALAPTVGQFTGFLDGQEF